MTTIHGVIHGKTIELEKAPGLPDGAAITVAIIVLKHLTLAVVIGAPIIAFPRPIKTALRGYCPWGPKDR